MDNIVSIGNNFQEYAELKSLYDQQFAINQSLIKQIQTLQAEIEHLKTLLGDATPVLEEKPPLVVSDEQAICEIQIKKLQTAAMQRELTLEETKRLDLLVKNLYLAKGQSTQIVTNNFNPGAFTNEELINIASQTE